MFRDRITGHNVRFVGSVIVDLVEKGIKYALGLLSRVNKIRFSKYVRN